MQTFVHGAAIRSARLEVTERVSEPIAVGSAGMLARKRLDRVPGKRGAMASRSVHAGRIGGASASGDSAKGALGKRTV
jgi:hypothetical protein